MKRRTFLQAGLGVALGGRLLSAAEKDEVNEEKLDDAAGVLANAASSGQVHAASLFVQQRGGVFARSFGAAKSMDAIFLLASISKPISAAAVMKLHDEEEFRLDDPVKKFIPEFKGDGREKITMRQLLTHTSGLPDQLPENAKLRSGHAELAEFVAAAIRTPLLFAPGARYGYSSMAILLATEAAQRISGTPFPKLLDESVLRPLGMKHSALGLGKFKLDDVMPCQVEKAAPESGGGAVAAKDWDWNSPYWRKIGAPWGGAHGSAADVARFLAEFLHPSGKALRPKTARLMIANQNPEGIRRRGLGFDLAPNAGCPKCGPKTFGHTGSTGTLCWADPAADAVCVILTTLPARAADPHPRDRASELVADAVA